MTRVALLGDPTRGLGNVAEPECRRIIAALDLARTERDPRVREAAERLREATDTTAGAARARLAETTATVRSAKLGEVADEFDAIHTVQRALAVGSVDRIITAGALRPYIVDSLIRGMTRPAAGGSDGGQSA
jgi:hypothetical protein